MYDCRFVSTGGSVFKFGYDNGTIFDLDPLSELDVDISTSQGFLQNGEIIEAETVGGVSREIRGVFVDYTKTYLARNMISVFSPGVHGTLYFNDEYYCECVVQKTPSILLSNHKRTFSLMLYSPYPYWYKVGSSTAEIGGYVGAFEFPVCYDSHVYGVKNSEVYVNCYNSGGISTWYEVTFTSESSDISNYGIKNIYTDEYLKINDTLSYGEETKVYRDEGKLRVEKTVDGETTDILSLLDEGSTLFTMAPGDNVIEHFADDSTEDLVTTFTLNPAYVGVVAT